MIDLVKESFGDVAAEAGLSVSARAGACSRIGPGKRFFPGPRLTCCTGDSPPARTF